MNKQKGFSLFELLVVVSIIGILIGVTSVSFSNAQKKARDARRREDMQAFQKAMEQYYADNSSSYPADCDVGSYLPGGISDPKNSGTYVYSNVCSASAYCACAHLENTGTGNANAAASSTSCSFGAGDYYCVQNQQ